MADTCPLRMQKNFEKAKNIEKKKTELNKRYNTFTDFSYMVVFSKD